MVLSLKRNVRQAQPTINQCWSVRRILVASERNSPHRHVYRWESRRENFAVLKQCKPYSTTDWSDFECSTSMNFKRCLALSADTCQTSIRNRWIVSTVSAACNWQVRNVAARRSIHSASFRLDYWMQNYSNTSCFTSYELRLLFDIFFLNWSESKFETICKGLSVCLLSHSVTLRWIKIVCRDSSRRLSIEKERRNGKWIKKPSTWSERDLIKGSERIESIIDRQKSDLRTRTSKEYSIIEERIDIDRFCSSVVQRHLIKTNSIERVVRQGKIRRN